MAAPVLQVEGVSFSYGDRPTLTDVCLVAQAGEIVGIIGPNGSGKSTLLRLVAGVLRPQQGRIAIAGEDLRRLSRVQTAQRVAVVPQSPHLPDSFTAWEVVLLGRTPYLRLLQSEGPRDFAAVQRAMEICGVWQLAERRMGDLSGGERQRVVIARALAQEPQLLLLDEPTAHLDINHQTAILDLIAALGREQGLAVVAVFHDLNLAAQYCQRLVILRSGQVLAEGTPREVITPQNISMAYGTTVCVVAHPHNQLPVALVTGNNHRERTE